MKKANKILTAASLMLMSLACSRLEDFDHHTFASFGDDDYLVSETVGTVKIPVNLYNCDGDVNVIIKASDGTAVSGKDYTIVEPASGVLSFAKGETTKDVTVKINARSGEYTGNLSFAIALSSSSDGLGVGSINNVSITIKDLDHPLASIVGDYTVTCEGALYGPAKYTMTLSLDENDPTVVWCNRIVPMLAVLANYGTGYVKGVVSEDKATISFASQPLDPKGGTAFNVGYGTFSLFSGRYVYVDGDEKDQYGTSKEPIVFTRADADGIVYKSGSGPCIVDSYVWPTYGGFILGEDNGKEVVWTKK